MMKHSENTALPGNQAKAFSLIIACFAGSLVLSVTVVAFVIRWLSES